MKFKILKIVICIRVTLDQRREGLPKKIKRFLFPLASPLRYIGEENTNNKKVA